MRAVDAVPSEEEVSCVVHSGCECVWLCPQKACKSGGCTQLAVLVFVSHPLAAAACESESDMNCTRMLIYLCVVGCNTSLLEF